jgi:hypothetical protein
LGLAVRRREILVEGWVQRIPRSTTRTGLIMSKKTAVPEIKITCDSAGWAAAIRGAADPAAVVVELVRQTSAAGMIAGQDLLWGDIRPKLVDLLMRAERDGFTRGRKAAARSVELGADAAAALGKADAPAVVVVNGKGG